MDAIVDFAHHVVTRRYADLPEAAVGAARLAILDTLGVGIAGSSEPMAGELADLQAATTGAREARVWGNGLRLPAAAAAMCNAYQVHNAEFDCLHEAAVVHALTVVLPATLAAAERKRSVSGADLITAVALGVDVAAGLGVAATTGMRFFRPATAGCLGATAAVGRLMGLEHAAMVHALSIAYGQACGTMQAHAEGSGLLAMQMGFNARNALVACDLAARGFTGPMGVLEGMFGYFRLFETAGSPGPVAAALGRRWFITELAHKPYPSGRATHGIIEACVTLHRRHAIDAGSISQVSAHVPPLVLRLVGRPARVEMDANYARLSAPYVAATALLTGRVGREAFTPQACRHPPTQGLAQRMQISAVDAGDPNALTPIEVTIDLSSGARHTCRIDTVYGNPAKPMSRADLSEKLKGNCGAALHPLPRGAAERLMQRVEVLQEIADIGELVGLLSA
jgi:aconitate decarboxylase